MENKLEISLETIPKSEGNKIHNGRNEVSDNSGFNPSYEIMNETYGVNPYSIDCCRCNPQRC